jgi:hypothetical protein
MKLIVTSFGGVGTTYLMRSLEGCISLNDANDKDGLKHTPIPPIAFHNIKVIYVFGQPDKAVASLFRRNFQTDQYTKLNLLARLKPKPILSSLEDYAVKGVDSLNLEKHYDNWRYRFKFYPILFIRYDKIYDEREKILSFLDLPLDLAGEFEKFTERKSSIEDVAVQDNLNKIYFSLKMKLENEKAVFEVAPKIGLYKLFLISEYWLYFILDLVSRIKFSIKKFVRIVLWP